MCTGRGVITHATLVVPPDITARFEAVLGNDLETGAVLLASTGRAPDGSIRLLAREFHEVPTAEYADRRPDEMTITSSGYVAALGRAEEIGAVPIWLHTHPGVEATSRPSVRDREVDRALADVFKVRSSREMYGALILAHNESELDFSGHLDVAGTRLPISRLWEVGPRLRLTTAHDSSRRKHPASSLFDRNVRALGGPVQRVLGDLHVGIVGCGGTGSAVGEQLARLGIRQFTLLDPDTLSESNLTRVYGSAPDDVGTNKATLLGDHIELIAPDARVTAIEQTVTTESAARHLVACDVVFGCTDDNAGRLVLSRFATYFLTPVIDCGVLLSSDSSDQLIGVDGRVTILVPGGACLVCRDRVDLQRAQAEALTPAERKRLQDEGYAPALPGVEPAVVTFTTGVAAAATAELLERLIGYGPDPVPSEVLIRFHEREFSTNTAAPRPGHYCDPAAGKLGFGDSPAFLEQTWAA
jgi:molybdopterin/thiamine biosynthesis adenylyltransferase